MGPHSRPLRSSLSILSLTLAASAFGCATYYDDGDYDRGYYGYGRPGAYHRYESYGYPVYERSYPVYVPVYRDRDGDYDGDHPHHADRDRGHERHRDRDWDGDHEHADRGHDGGYAPPVVAPPARPRPPDDSRPDAPHRVDRHRIEAPREVAQERGSWRANGTLAPGDRGNARQDVGAPRRSRAELRAKPDRDESAED